MNVVNPVIVHWTADMGAAIAFYRSVFGLSVRTEGPYLSVLELPPISLLLHAVDDAAPERPLPHAGLNVEVDDLDEMLDLVQRYGGHVVRVREPEPPVPLRVAMCRDADGNGFEMRQRVTAES